MQVTIKDGFRYLGVERIEVIDVCNRSIPYNLLYYKADYLGQRVAKTVEDVREYD